MTLAQWPSIPDEFYYDHTENHDRDGPDYSLPVSKWMSRPAINVKHEILQALYSGLSGERAYALHLGETFEMLIEDHGLHVKLVASTAYQRFLVYCCSVYYKLAFGVDYYNTLDIFIVRTPTSLIPPLRIAEMVPTPPELSFANLRLAKLQLRSSKPTTPISTPTAQKIDRDKQEITIAKREAKYDAAAARIFVEEEPEKRPNNNDSDTHPAASPTVRILRRSKTTSSQTDSFPHDEEDVMDSNTSIPKQPPTKRPTMTLAEREEAYREARSRIFLGFEEAPTKHETNNDEGSDAHSSEEVDGFLDFKEPDPTFRRTTPAAKDPVVLIPAPTNPQPNPTVRFRLPPKTEPPIRAILSTTDIINALRSVSYEYEEDPENSETTSMSGAGSVYSHASSRTKSTDYGLYYTRRALSQESLSEIYSGTILRPLYKQ